jgi:hypothetical protein
MKSQAYFRRLLIGLALLGLTLTSPRSGNAAPTNVFSTQFEYAEGYNTNLDLAGQGPWVRSGSGGNGIVADFFPGQGQQAYVGFSAPDGGGDQLVVWPTNQFDPVAAGLPLVKFTTQIQIADSSNGEYDFFQWRVYNPQGQLLFLLDFDNYLTNINYLLDGNNGYTNSKVQFARNTTYSLSVTMNFASNRWSASLDNTLIVTNLPITTTNKPLGFGDVDAVWYLFDANAPGDNFMIFDNYRVTAETLTLPPAPTAQLQFLDRTTEGWALLRVLGTENSRWSVDATTNFLDWTALKTNTISGGSFDYVDLTASPLARRFYRARLAP